jgi:hypothetical protein
MSLKNLTIQDVEKRLNISVADIHKLTEQGILHPILLSNGTTVYEAEAIERMASVRPRSISDEAMLVGHQIQQEVSLSVKRLQKFRKTARVVGFSTASVFILSVLFVAFMFHAFPEKTSDFFGYYYRFNISKSSTLKKAVLSSELLYSNSNLAITSPSTSIVADILKPIAGTSLVAIKAIDGVQYTKIVTKPTTVSNIPTTVSTQGGSGTAGTNSISGLNGLNGPQGNTGNTGATGAQGQTGTAGAQGIPGAVGATGLTGPQGIQGPIGVTGATGAQGQTGTAGAQGIPGAVGATGLTGPQGIQGPIGVTGAQGVQGPVGATGLQGPAGPTGLTGPQGIQGPIGLTGAVGARGLTGPQGPQGLQGPIGVTGPQGPKGIQGLTGPQGIQGPIGLTGAVGARGLTGPQGVQGPAGPTGLTGPQGIAGPTGATLVIGATVNSSTMASANTQVSATASCRSGKQLLGGGGLVTTTWNPSKVALSASYPSSTTVWTVKGTVLSNLGAGETMSVTAYALCSL